jgi:hypothetical protein
LLIWRNGLPEPDNRNKQSANSFTLFLCPYLNKGKICKAVSAGKNFTKMKNYISLLLIVVVFTACDNVDKKDITVINGIVLGQKLDSAFYNQLPELGIENKLFCTTSFSLNEQENNNNTCYMSITKVFDLDEYAQAIPKEHFYGVLHFLYQTGTNNLVGLAVILGTNYENSKYQIHDNPTDLKSFFSSPIKIKTAEGYPYIDQIVKPDVLDAIETMLKNKYGKPASDTQSTHNIYFVLKNTRVNIDDSLDAGLFRSKVLTWETKNLEIKFVRGFNLMNFSVFDTKKESYGGDIVKDSTGVISADLKSWQVPCFSYPYILYQLKNETIKKLKLDKPNLPDL